MKLTFRSVCGVPFWIVGGLIVSIGMIILALGEWIAGEAPLISNEKRTKPARETILN